MGVKRFLHTLTMLPRIGKTGYLCFWDIIADNEVDIHRKARMNAHNYSHLGLNPLPGETPATPSSATTATLLPLDEPKPWTPELPSPHASLLPAPTVSQTTKPGQAVACQGFCQFCGVPVAPDVVLCVSCGRQIKPLQSAMTPGGAKAADKPASAAGFLLMVILTLAFPIAGFIFGISGLSWPGKQAQGGVLMALSIIVGVIYFFAFTPLHR